MCRLLGGTFTVLPGLCTRGGLYGQFVNWKRVMDGVHMYVLGGFYRQVVTGNKVPHLQCSTWLLVSLSCPSPPPTFARQTALRLGLGYPPLARAALDALDTWSTSLPPSLLQPYYSSLLPVLDNYLKAASDGECWW